MDNLSHMSYEELAKMQDDLRDILAARTLEDNYGLGGMDTSAVELLASYVGDALDAYEKAEEDYERREYERSVL